MSVAIFHLTASLLREVSGPGFGGWSRGQETWLEEALGVAVDEPIKDSEKDILTIITTEKRTQFTSPQKYRGGNIHASYLRN